MKSILLLSAFYFIYLPSSFASDLVVGTSFNQRVIWQEKMHYSGIPFKKRVKDVFFASPSQQIIRGIIVRDLEHSGAKASITAGGLGETYVNIKLKSERGDGFNYLIEIYG